MKWLGVVLGIIAGCIVGVHTGQAKTTSRIYQLNRTVSATAPGLEIPGLPGVRVLTSASQQSLLNLRERQSLQSSVTYRAQFTPNDPQFSLQWNAQVMRIPAAWDRDTVPPIHGGDLRIVVAVLDSGVASTLVGGTDSVPDIAPNTIWTNPLEIAGDGIDNDHDGYIDDLHGWNFVSNTARLADDNGHGTHVSGVIAAGTDNSLAIAGIASNVTIMPLKVLDAAGIGSTISLTAAVNYAVAHGANIINLSLGGDEDDPIFHQAIQTAVQQGIVVIGAAGNSGAATVTYPARYSEVIGVGATNTDNTRAAYSNYGPTLTLVAPGGDTNLDLNADGQRDGIPAQMCTDGSCTSFATIYLSGTSQAASEVTAVAALLESCGAAAGTIQDLLTSTALDLGAPGRDDVFGAGLVNADAALAAAGCSANAPTAPGEISARASEKSSVPVIANRPSPYTRPVFSWAGQAGATFVVTWKKGSSLLTQQRQTATSFSPTLSDEGVYTLTIATIDALDQTSRAVTFSYRYQKSVVVVSSGGNILLLKNDLKPLRKIATKIGKALTIDAGLLSGTNARMTVAAKPAGATVLLLDTKGITIRTVQPFGKNFGGAVTTAILQRADGSSQFVTATNTNGGALAWFSAAGKLLGRTSVYGTYRGGLNITGGDLNGDGTDELIVAQTRGAEIRVYDTDRKRQVILTPRGKRHVQGWSVAAGDINGDGRAEILATPNVGLKTTKILVLNSSGQELKALPVTSALSGPLLLASVDITGDGINEILTAPSNGSGTLRILSASGKLLQQTALPSTTLRSLATL